MFYSLKHFTRGSILALILSTLAAVTLICYTVTVPLTVNTNTPVLPCNLEANFLSVISQVVGLLISLLRFNVYQRLNTFGRYYELEVYNTSRANTLQLLVHPVTHTLAWASLRYSDIITILIAY